MVKIKFIMKSGASISSKFYDGEEGERVRKAHADAIKDMGTNEDGVIAVGNIAVRISEAAAVQLYEEED